MEERYRNDQSVIDELRRRKVLRTTTIYAVCGWCLLQWMDYLFERLGWPEWSLTLVLTFVVLGFPVTVALAWVFDISPAGVRATKPGSLSPGTRTPVSWIVDGAVLTLLAVTVVMLIETGAGI